MKHVMRPLAAAVLALPLLAHANADVEKNIANPKNWAMQAGDMYNQRYSKLNQINTGNVGKMQVAWTFSTGVLRGHEGSPLVIDGMMYLHSPFPNKVFAINLDTQKIVWKYEPKQDPAVIPQMCCDTVYRGLAYAENKVFLQQADSTLVALDANNGKVLWSVKNGDPKLGAVNTNAPHVFKDKVITGISGGSFTALAFGLYGDKLFDIYEADFLKRNVQSELVQRMLNPINWPALASTGWGRSELAANMYDEILFHGATFNDLKRDGPRILVSATDLADGTRLIFSPENFDALCTDLSSVRLARHSCTTPINVLATNTKPNKESAPSPKIRMRTNIDPSNALMRVNTLARRISPTVRLVRSSAALTCPACTRSATSAAVSPPGPVVRPARATVVSLIGATL